MCLGEIGGEGTKGGEDVVDAGGEEISGGGEEVKGSEESSEGGEEISGGGEEIKGCDATVLSGKMPAISVITAGLLSLKSSVFSVSCTSSSVLSDQNNTLGLPLFFF